VPVMYSEMRRQKYRASPSRWSSKVGKFGGVPPHPLCCYPPFAFPARACHDETS
jgi:hypothetical protein